MPVHMMLIPVDAPMTAVDNNVINEVYELFEEMLIKSPRKDINLVLGDLNIKVGAVSSQ